MKLTNRYGWLLIIILIVPVRRVLAVSMAGGESAGGQYSQMDLFLLITYILMALIFSFLCSVAEAVLLSITPSFIAGLKESKPKLAATLKRLKQEKVDQSLAAILTLNTIAHTVGAIGSGAKATVVFGSAWFGLFSAVMTLMILFFSEIIPKTLGAVFWRSLAWPTAMFVRGLIIILYPLIRISEGLTHLVAGNKHAQIFNREEFIAMADIGKQAGEIDESESRIIRNLFRLGSLTSRDIMTPRTVISGLQKDLTVAQALEENPLNPFSRLPLFGKDLDDIVGFILKDDLLLAKAHDQDDVPLERLKREISTVTGEMPISTLLEYLLDNRQHIALILGEYGGTRGLVTLEDVVETLLGMEIVDELDTAEDMQTLARQQWEKRAKARGIDLDHPSLNPPENETSISPESTPEE